MNEHITKVYTDYKKAMYEKIEYLKKLQTEAAEVVVEEENKLFGVKVGDSELSEYVSKPANIWGGAQTKKEGEEVLKLDKKFRLNIKLDKKSNSTEIEKGLVKLRWETQENVDTNANEEFIADHNDFNLERKKVDLSTLKATDLRYNRRLYAPKAAEHKLETNLQQTKIALEEVF